MTSIIRRIEVKLKLGIVYLFGSGGGGGGGRNYKNTKTFSLIFSENKSYEVSNLANSCLQLTIYKYKHLNVINYEPFVQRR